VKLPHVRFTVRRIMLAVAIIAGLLGALSWAARMTHLARTYRAQAEYLTRTEHHNLDMAATYDRQSSLAQAAGETARAHTLALQATQARQYAAQIAAWSRAYERVALQPWKRVPPGTIHLMAQAPPSPIDLVPNTLRGMGTPALVICLTCLLGLAAVGHRGLARHNPSPASSPSAESREVSTRLNRTDP
jgi:hypothetical protein